MQFVTKAQWGGRPFEPNGDAPITSNRGVKVHYLGSLYELVQHSHCAAKVRSVQNEHMDGRGYADIGYSLMVCRHGYVFEGRGPNRQCAANGEGAGLNRNHYAVLGMVGTEPGFWNDLVYRDYWNYNPTEAMKRGIRDAIAYLRYYGGAGSEILGHRDGYATACPGPALYDLV
uniref:peptidoglycan recognition protein family protein n=1 Tax=Nocardiopsis sp. FR4 TaxID=2605985 RepID=UPI0013583BAA